MLNLNKIDWSIQKTYCKCGQEILLDPVWKDKFKFTSFRCNTLNGKLTGGAVYVYYNNKSSPIGRVLLDLVGKSRNIQADHIDGNIHNNLISNLRIASCSQNITNKIKYTGTSKYIGVDWHKCTRMWRARVKVNRETKYIGIFESEEAAAKARDVVACELHGEFAVLNFPKCKSSN